MKLVSILFQQIMIMYIFMFIGVILFKTKKLSLEGSKALGNILIYAVMPAVVIKAFLNEMTAERLKGLGIAFVLSFAVLLLAMVVSLFLFKKRPIENFGASFSNAGFIGIPLVSALYGDEAVFYVSAFVALLNLLQWTYGVCVITKNKKAISLKKILTNPILISLVVGLILFVCQIQVPAIIISSIQGIASLNAPLAMFSLGTYLAQVSWKEIFTNRYAYLSSVIRLLVVPLLTLGILSFVPSVYSTMKMAILIAASTPIGSNVAIFAQIHNQDYKQAVRIICLSTLCSILTMPMIMMLAERVW
ncbi:MAG: AEC family transporter [Beduini sp.]|uniref:AEC family transporter n=1 Tax=Beduini sp. TaxID=1922300 RepID=UPI003990857C